MHSRENDLGFTLIELVIAVAILSTVLGSIFLFFQYTMKSFHYVETHYQAEFNAKKVIWAMSDHIREANMVVIGGSSHYGVEILGGGLAMNVYSDIDEDGVAELIHYKIEDRQLFMGTAELGSNPSSYTVLADQVNNTATEPAFTVSGKKISIRLMLQAEASSLREEPVSIATSIAVRNKGAMSE